MKKKPIRDTRLHLGCSPLTGNIYLGKQNKGLWVGVKRDVTSEFLQVMEHKFPINTNTIIEANGKKLYRLIAVDMDKEVLINGKNIKDKRTKE